MLTLQNQAHKRLPWFLILRTQQLKRTCANPSVTRPFAVYNMQVRRLVYEACSHYWPARTTWNMILTSMYGWLPNSFSTAKVDLLIMDVSELCSPVFDISAPPSHWFACCFLYAATFLMRSFGFVYVAVENLHWPQECMGRKSMGNFMVQVLLLILYSSMDNGLVFIRWMILALLMLWVEVGSSWIHQRLEEMTCMEMPKQCRKWSRMVAECLCWFIMLLGM